MSALSAATLGRCEPLSQPLRIDDEKLEDALAGHATWGHDRICKLNRKLVLYS